MDKVGTTPRLWSVYREEDGRIITSLYAASEASALLGAGWGYSGARFELERDGRPAMVTATDVYRARPEPMP